MQVTETRRIRQKRLWMRSIRRGIKEMDIILTRYAEQSLPEMSDAQLDLYEALLSENDQDLYQWITGQVAAPETLRPLVADITQCVSAS